MKFYHLFIGIFVLLLWSCTSLNKKEFEWRLDTKSDFEDALGNLEQLSVLQEDDYTTDGDLTGNGALLISKYVRRFISLCLAALSRNIRAIKT